MVPFIPTPQMISALAAFNIKLITAGLLGAGGAPGIIQSYDPRFAAAYPPVVGQPVIFWQEGLTSQQIATHQATFDGLLQAHTWVETREEMIRRMAKEVFTQPQTFGDYAANALAEVLRQRDSLQGNRWDDLLVHINSIRQRIIDNGHSMAGVPAIPLTGPNDKRMPVFNRQAVLDAVVAQLLLDLPDVIP